jgi:hypothetical protein
MKATIKLWIGLAALVVLSPLGLILPAKFSAGSAWGEWSGEEMQQLVGYVPAGMSRLASLWKAPMPDYALKGQQAAPLGALSMSYILSGVVGVAVVVLLTILLGKALARRERTEAS